MKIAVGMCGLGFGHGLRQSFFIGQLQARGHRLVLFGFENSRAFCQRRFPDIPCLEVALPWLPSGPEGLDFTQAGEHPRNRAGIWGTNFRAMARAIEVLGGPPDLVISDYCPTTASFAYGTGAPLCTIDNQSKFLGYQFPDVAGLSRLEERARLALYLPAAAARLATSFFRVPHPADPQFSVQLFAPVLRPQVRQLDRTADSRSAMTVVYLSPYLGGISLADTVATLARLRPRRFVVFSRDATTAEHGNVSTRGFDETGFLACLAASDSVITNAGSNVLCEALYLGRPVLSVPFRTFEQTCNAEVVASGGFGVSVPELTVDGAAAFFRERGRFREALAEELARPRRLQCRDGSEEIMAWLTDRFRE